jgi:serine/threonine protein kinase
MMNRLLKLLSFEPKAQRFLDGVIENVKASGLAEEVHEESAEFDDQLGTTVGRYKLLEKIGEGGCGVVYMAEQKEPVRRRVAVKIIKLGMDTKSVIARFGAERQALALMDHPNIARVLDAGATDTGRPYFVMELVRGFKITEYCDANELTMQERLELFIQVCHAIQHAHQKGVIHRDIKPSNILVTEHDNGPVPKVIDFGIAKAIEEPLTDLTLFTSYSQLIGTPAYMSPEQAQMTGADIDTRSDIYSLGVLLYELLTGKTPFDGQELISAGIDNLRQTLRDKEPQRPSTMVTTMVGQELQATAKRRRSEPLKLITELGGDLDWIVMKALEKERPRRYQTANGLAMEIQRYLAHEPVLARPPSRFYLLRKLVRRNQVTFTAGAVVFLALSVGFGTSTWLFFRERESRKIAVQAKEQESRLREAAERGATNALLLQQAAESREKSIQAASQIQAGHFEEAEKLITAIPQKNQTMEGVQVLRSLGEWHAVRGEWINAANLFDTVLKVNQSESTYFATLDYERQVCTLLKLNDVARYDELRQDMAGRFIGTTERHIADRVLRYSLLLRPQTNLLESIQPYVTCLTNQPINPASFADDSAWHLLGVGLYHYRTGHYSEGADYCQKCADYTGLAGPNSARVVIANILLAMCDAQLGKEAEAQFHYDAAKNLVDEKCRKPLPATDGFSSWFDWIYAQILLTEAEACLNSKREPFQPQSSGPRRQFRQNSCRV